jgi:hypothetical protein
VEFQVTPNNQQLQLRFANHEALQRARRTDAFEEFLLPVNTFRSRTWVQPGNRKWFVHASIPAILVGGLARLNAGGRWHFSFSRYANTHGGEPVISSTSPHAAADFHRQQEWGELVFTTAELSRNHHA